MNQSDLLDQFLLESRECIEQVGQCLLQVERDPRNSELLNDLFRSVHTLKGNCGLFDFKALESIVHAGEDLLDKVRGRSMDFDAGIADALLEAMDYSAELIDAIEKNGALPIDCEGRAASLEASLRALLARARPDAVVIAPRVAADPAPGWLSRLPVDPVAAGPFAAVRYLPDAECFFKGEDPWQLARSAPGIAQIEVREREAWPAPDAFDCYVCNLDIAILCRASREEVEQHFRFVPEQIEIRAVNPQPASASVEQMPVASRIALPTGSLIQARIADLWASQTRMLLRSEIAPETLESIRRVFGGLLACCGDGAATSVARQSLPKAGDGAAGLADWSRAFVPAADGVRQVSESVATFIVPHLAPVGIVRDVVLGPTGKGSAGETEGGQERAGRVLKVGQEKVDLLMDLIGEMVVAKNALPYLAIRAESVFQQRELAREVKAQYQIINRIAEDLQHAIMQVRMLPVSSVLQRFSRLVRDIGKKLGKEVDLLIVGEETEADKNVVEALADPLIHILRNSLDHGIEMPSVRLAAGKAARGVLRVEARQEGDHVLVEVSDDGAGVDIDRVRAKAVERGLVTAGRAGALSDAEVAQLVFLPGFSTAETVSDLSGRGVGMDVVRTAVERINGSAELSSIRGRGTTVRLTLPLSIAVANVMLIEAAGRRFGVPMELIVETVRIDAADIHSFKRARTIVLRDRIVPLRALHQLLCLDAEPRTNEDGEFALLIVRKGHEIVGLIVDDFHGTSDIILKPLEGVLAGLTGFAGTALMGDGSVLMILNPKELL